MAPGSQKNANITANIITMHEGREEVPIEAINAVKGALLPVMAPTSIPITQVPKYTAEARTKVNRNISKYGTLITREVIPEIVEEAGPPRVFAVVEVYLKTVSKTVLMQATKNKLTSMQFNAAYDKPVLMSRWLAQSPKVLAESLKYALKHSQRTLKYLARAFGFTVITSL